MLLRNRLYAGIVDVPEDGVRARRGDFEPLISEDLFYRVQWVLSGRMSSTLPRRERSPRTSHDVRSSAAILGEGLSAAG